MAHLNRGRRNSPRTILPRNTPKIPSLLQTCKFLHNAVPLRTQDIHGDYLKIMGAVQKQFEVPEKLVYANELVRASNCLRGKSTTHDFQNGGHMTFKNTMHEKTSLYSTKIFSTFVLPPALHLPMWQVFGHPTLQKWYSRNIRGFE